MNPLDVTPLDAERVRAVLAARQLNREYRIGHVPETGSTNADLRLLTVGADEVRVLATDHQRAGRGRSGRQWSCPPGAGLMVSLRFRPRVEARRLGWTGALLGLALRAAGQQLGLGTLDLKWPNDVQIHGLKLAGVLAEAAGDGDVIVGIGVNVSLTAAELPRADATSLLLQGFRLDREELLARLLIEFDAVLDRWEAGAGDLRSTGLLADYRTACVTLGKHVRAELPGGGEITGTAADIDDDGRLIVDTLTGMRTALSAADVHHLRPATPHG